MATVTIPAHAGRAVGSRAGKRKSRGFILFFFTMIFLLLALPGVEMATVPVVGLLINLVEAVFLVSVLIYLVCNADFVFKSMPGLLVSAFFLVSAFYASELCNNKNFFLASFEAVKLLTPYFAFMAIFRFAKQSPETLLRYVRIIVITCYVLSLVGIFLLPSSLIHGRGIAPAYFGAGLHTSAYVICLAGICAYVLWTRGALDGRIAIGMILATLGLITVVWNVRTTILLFVVFLTVHYWRVTRMLVPAALALVAGGVMYAFMWDSARTMDALVQFSSGRLSMWAYKLQLLTESTFLQFLFGKGIGSDFVVSDIWWWGAKDSHNDYLHLMTELGLTGVVMFVVTVLAQRAVLPRNESMATALMVAYLTASAFSNGLTFRPMPSLLFALVLGMTAIPPRSGAKE